MNGEPAVGIRVRARWAQLRGADVVPLARPLGVVLAGVGAVRAAALMRPPDRPGLLDSPWPWLIGSLVVFVLVTAGQPVARWIVAHEEAGQPARLWLMAVAMAAGSAAMLAYALGLAPQPALIVAWAAGQIAWIAAFVPWRPHRPAISRAGWLEMAGVVAMLAVAAAMRLWGGSELPLRFHGDMASYGLQAREMLQPNALDFFGVGWAAIPVMGYLPYAATLAVFGDSLAGLNAAPAIMGLLSLVGVYLLGRDLFGWRPALFALALAAGAIAHLHFSRSAAYIDPVMWIVWSVYFLVLGLRHGRLWAMATGGVLAAWAIQTYYPGRLIVPLLALLLVVTALAGWRALWSRGVGVGVAVAGLLLGMGPALVYFARKSHDFTARTQDVLLTTPDVWTHTAAKYGLERADVAGVLWQQVQRAGLGFWRFSDGTTQFGIERPMLDPLAGGLLLLGIGYALWRLRQPAALLLLGWGLGYIAAAATTVDPPGSTRMLGIVAPAALLGGLALDRGLRVLLPGRRWTIAALALGLVTVGVSMGITWRDYVAWGTSGRSVELRTHIARFLMAQPADIPIVMISSDYGWKDRDFEFLLPDHTGMSIAAEVVAKDATALPPGRLIVILGQEALPLVALLQERYPAGRLIDGSIPPVRNAFHAFLIESK